MGEAKYDDKYAVSSRIMLGAVVVLIAVIVLMAALHIYTRCFLIRPPRHRRRFSGHRRRTSLIFYAESANAAAPSGLNASVLKSLPVFSYSSETNVNPLECTVCLSEFEENDAGRRLPGCNHCFHLDCIDMWFHSHSTCPICRCSVESGPIHEDCSTREGTLSFDGGRRRLDISIEIPGRESFRRPVESGAPSPALKSPANRVLSLKRILARDIRAVLSPSSAVSCSRSGEELDLERGGGVAGLPAGAADEA